MWNPLRFIGPLAVFTVVTPTHAEAPPAFADISRLLQAKCAKCHGDKVHKADLDLTTQAGMLKGGESGTVIVPGEPDKSPLFEKVHSGAMPPKKIERCRQPRSS